jgi:hypothetical protein
MLALGMGIWYPGGMELRGEGFPRYFARATHEAAYGCPTGWYVCDEKLRDKVDRPKAIHDEPCADEAEARYLAEALNNGA